jgi:TonB family protein
MAHDLFGEVTTRSVKVGSQAWYTLPLSIATHVIVCALVLIVPFTTSELLPMPQTVGAFYADPELPEAPPPPAAPAPAASLASAQPLSSSAAPIDAPEGIADEPAVPPGPPSAGVVGGIGSIGETLGAGVVHIPAAPAPPPAPRPEAVRPGGVIKYPAKVHHVPPVYPRIAQEAKVSGMVILEAIIGTDGRVQDVRIVRSKALLDQAAIDAVKQWRFTPTLLNGGPVPVILTVTVNFQLQ